MGLQDGEDFGFGEVEAEGFHGDFELVVVDLVVLVQVKEVELVSRWRISTSVLLYSHDDPPFFVSSLSLPNRVYPPSSETPAVYTAHI